MPFCALSEAKGMVIIMNNGAFKITLSTPMGLQSGIVHFIDDNGVLSGSLRAMGNENPFANGRTNGSSFEFTGSLKTLFGKIDYTARGAVTGDTLQATAVTKFGLMQINGNRVKN